MITLAYWMTVLEVLSVGVLEVRVVKQYRTPCLIQHRLVLVWLTVVRLMIMELSAGVVAGTAVLMCLKVLFGLLVLVLVPNSAAQLMTMV